VISGRVYRAILRRLWAPAAAISSTHRHTKQAAGSAKMDSLKVAFNADVGKLGVVMAQHLL
jgi:hypothetical protein